MNDYDNYTNEQLINKIHELEKDLNNTKTYGLVWDRKKVPEFVVQRCAKDIPFIYQCDELMVENGGLNHLLIEGDNYHSLLCLNYVLRNSVDIIYIDPPYNTLKETSDGGFVYNDKRVDENDKYKHSEWINFMYERLKLAKELLSEDGSIFISIDDHEAANLKLLCDQIFGSSHFVTMIPRITKSQRAAQEQYMDVSHDYILVYSRADDFENITAREVDESKIKKDNIGYFIPGDTKAILADKSKGYSAGGDYDFEYNGKIYKPVDSNGYRNRWLWTRERMEAAARLGILVETKSSLRMQLYLDKKFDDKTNTMVPKDENLLFHTADFMTNKKFANSAGVQDLQKISLEINRKFNNPKPVSLIKKIISFCKNKDCTVLDFFAGSGTTGQAVLELNAEDGGNRHFILCTNNEKNICSDVTYPRIKTILSGIKDDGSCYDSQKAGSLFYFKTDFLSDYEDSDQAKYSLAEKINDSLCIAEDCFELEKQESSIYVYKNRNEKHLVIYNDFYNAQAYNRLKEILDEIDGEKVVYLFTLGNEIDESVKEMFGDVKIKPFPSKIYDIYKQIAEEIKKGL